MDPGHHLCEEELERYSLRATTEPELTRVEEHLLLCDSCRKRADGSDAYVGSMQHAAGLLRQEAASAPKWWGLPQLALAAGGVCLLVAVILFARKTPPPFAVSLAAIRGTGIEARAPEGAPLALQLDVTGLPAASSYNVEIVDRGGKRVWSGTFPGKNVDPPPAGIYFVRLYSPAGELLREYGLEIGPGQ